jgi:hypothetical protein
VPTFRTLIRHAHFGGTVGLPGISIPVGAGAQTGLPIGVELTSRPGEDDHLLAVAVRLAPLILDVTLPSQLVAIDQHHSSRKPVLRNPRQQPRQNHDLCRRDLTPDGKAIGAIGVSGGSGEQDQTVAEAGANALTGPNDHS